jgi:hypothetical protein
VWASFADDLVRENTPKHILDEGWLRGVLHLHLKTVEQDLRELIDVHLLGYVSGVSFIILEGVAEVFGVVELPIAIPQGQEDFLHLIQQVLFFELWGVKRVLAVGESIPQTRYHVQVLHESIHVADTA